MQPLHELNAIQGECDRVIKGMLDGTVTRDDGLFVSASILKRVTTNLSQFVTYALPILQTVHQAMLTAQAQAPQAQAPQAPQAQAPQAQAPQAPQAQAPQAQAQAPHGATSEHAPVAPSDIQTVDATVKVRP